jgi:3-oxoacyl-[acyl-carrier protein] reductase
MLPDLFIDELSREQSPKGVAVVTGAAGGIGAAVVDRLRKQSWKVAGVDRDPSTADMTHVVDLRDVTVVASLLDRIRDVLGEPTALVNAAGVYQAVSLLETSPEYINDVMAVNVTAPIILARELIRLSVERSSPASIVNITSVVGWTGGDDPAYGASKGALISMTKGLAKAFGSMGIRVNAIAPGIVNTPMARSIPVERLQNYMASIPAGRFADADEIAAGVEFLLSSDASYINGAIIDINGGLV